MSGGLPQLDTSLYPEQIFWLAVSFALLYGLMAFVALPVVRRTQDKRAAVIAAELAAASSANEQARAAMAQYEKALADARTEAQATVGKITVQAAQESAARQAIQQQELAKRLAEAEAKILAARDAAIKDIKASSADLAGAIIQKITGLRLKVRA